MSWDKINSENLAMGRLKCKLRQVAFDHIKRDQGDSLAIHQGLSSEGHWAALYCYLVFTLVRGCNPFSKGQMRWERVNFKKQLILL